MCSEQPAVKKFLSPLERNRKICYNKYIMKKYFFLPALTAAALLLSSCSRDSTATVVYTDVPPPLTRMTYAESLPPETYSEYMETYTVSESETSDDSRFGIPHIKGFYADTGVTAPTMQDGFASLRGDTAVTSTETSPPGSEDTASEVSGAETSVTETAAESVTETVAAETSSESSETTVTTTVTRERPKADTGIREMVDADTAVSRSEASETDGSISSDSTSDTDLQ